MKKYYAQTSDQEDMRSIGTIGLIKGFTTFDASKGARLATYAARCVEKYNVLTNGRREMDSLPNPPKRPVWRILDQVTEDFFILNRTQNGYVRYVPLYILQRNLPLSGTGRKTECHQ